MPQFQMLPANPSFSSQLGQNLGQGLGTGLQQGIAHFFEEKKFNRQQDELRAKNKQASLDKLPSYASKYAKDFHPLIERSPERKRKFLELAKGYIDKDYSLNEAMELAAESLGSKSKEGPGFSPTNETSQGDLWNWLTNERSQIDPVTGRPSGERDRYGLASFAKEYPAQAAASIPLEALNQAESLSQFADPVQGILKILGAENTPRAAEIARKATGISDLPEWAQKEAEIAGIVGTFVPWGKLLGGAFKLLEGTSIGKGLGKLFSSASTKSGVAVEKIAEESIAKAAQAGVNLEKVAAGDKVEAKRLYQVIKGEQKAPTASATERVAAETPKFHPKAEMKLREAQLKEHPKYAEEIQKDASEMAARREAQAPKTEVGEAGVQSRKAVASHELPKVENSYRSVLARKRAVENAYSAAGQAEKTQMKPLLEAVKKETADAEELYNRTVSNARSGGSKKGPQTNREAAQQKALKISDDIAEGKDVVLKKADYNPEMIKEAASISKKRMPTGTGQGDFYTKVHDEYEAVYKQTLDRVNKEIQSLGKSVKSLSEAQQVRALEKEKEALEKLIKQTQAEKIIHQRKLHLRELGERQKSASRFKELSPEKAVPSPKVEEVASKKLEESSKSFFEKPTTQKAEQIAKESGIPKESVEKAGDVVQDLKDLKSGKSQLKQNILQKVKQDFSSFIEGVKTMDAKLLSKNPFALSLAHILSDMAGYKIPSWAQMALGRRSLADRVIRSAVIGAYKSGKAKYQKESYKSAIKRGDERAILEKEEKYPTKLLSQARKEVA